MGYSGYYFAWVLASYLMREPRLLVGLVALFLLRGFLPAPGPLLGALGRAGRLREQVRVNRANITARRDLATIYLAILRPRRAVGLLEEGLALAPQDAELLYLLGVALHRAGRHQEALDRLLAAIERDQRLRHGLPYLAAGEALLALKRWDDAADAFERYLDFNGSDVAAHTLLARAHASAGAADQARQWLLAGLKAWHALPGSLKRRQLGAYLRGQWARITVLHDAGAAAVAVLLLLGLVAGGRALYPWVAALWEPNEAEQRSAQLEKSAALCGTQNVGDFVGLYDATPELPGHGPASLGVRKLDPEVARRWQEEMAPAYADFRIEPHRIVMGGEQRIEYCVSRVIERKPGSLHAEAVLRVGLPTLEDDDAFGLPAQPGARVPVALFDVRLDRGAEVTRFAFAPSENRSMPTLVTLRRRAE